MRLSQGECNQFFPFTPLRRDNCSQSKNLGTRAHISYAWTLTTRINSPQCLVCQVELTIEHILLIVYLLQVLVNYWMWGLSHRDQSREINYHKLFCLFVYWASHSIIDFIRYTGFYHKMHVFACISNIFICCFSFCILFMFILYINIFVCSFMLFLSVS